MPDEPTDIPDVGAVRSAEYLGKRLDREVSDHAIVELARTGAISMTGTYKGHPLYSGTDLAGFDDLEALERAEVHGRMVSADGAAAVLGIRRIDIDHLIRAGLIRPVKWVHTGYARGHYTARYRTGDLLDLEQSRPDIDWAAVRTTAKGRPSPLRTLPAASPQNKEHTS